jgi:hypothetical protein
MKLKISKEKILEASQNSGSMAKAASSLNIHFNTFKRLAILYKCYFPNQGLKGGNKITPSKINLQEILHGLHPHFQTYKLKNRILKEGLMDNSCTICGIEDWNDKPLKLELDHIDGVRTNHELSNLRLLCPNCHSQTDTYRSKKRG